MCASGTMVKAVLAGDGGDGGNGGSQTEERSKRRRNGEEIGQAHLVVVASLARPARAGLWPAWWLKRGEQALREFTPFVLR
jgi:hypothetical protein